MGTMMEVLDKIMSNIMGVTLGALIMFVGLFIEPISSISSLPNLMIFGGIYIIILFMAIAMRQYVDTINPDFGRVMVIARVEQETQAIVDLGKTKAFNTQRIFYGLLLAGAAVSGVSTVGLGLIALCLLASEGIARKFGEKGKPMAYDKQILLYGILFLLLPFMGANWIFFLGMTACCLINEGIALYITYKAFMERRAAKLEARKQN